MGYKVSFEEAEQDLCRKAPRKSMRSGPEKICGQRKIFQHRSDQLRQGNTVEEIEYMEKSDFRQKRC